MAENEKNNEVHYSPTEIQYLLKKIDRKLKTVTQDSEISGEPNYLVADPDNIPLQLNTSNQLNLMGGLTVAGLIEQLDNSAKTFANDRIKRYDKLEEVAQHPEIDGALNIYANETFTEDQHGEIFQVFHPKEHVIEIVEDLFDRLNMNDKGWLIVKNMCTFGDDFWEIIISQSLKRIIKINWLPRKVLSRVEENNTLKGFQVNITALETQNTYYGLQYDATTKDGEKEKNLIFPFRILHFKINSTKYGIYGQSVIDSAVTTIEQLQLMERAMIINRVTRAAERRIFHIDVGNLSGDNALAYAKKAVGMLKQKRSLDVYLNNAVDWQKDIFGTTEDIVMPKRAGSDGNSIDTLPAAGGLSETGDLEFIRDKLFPAIGIPRQYLFDDTFANANTNLSSKSKPFAKKIKRIQRAFLYTIYKLAIIELKLHSISNEDIQELVILMNNPSNIDEKEMIEIQTSLWGLVSTIKSNNAEKTFYPDYLIYKEVLKLSDEEIVELMRISQLQMANKNIFQAFPPSERPEGSEILDNPPPPANTGEAIPSGGMGGGGAPMGGGEAPPPEGGEAGAEIPPEVEAAFGPPPKEGGEAGAEGKKPETADVEFDKNATTGYTEDNKLNTALTKKTLFLESLRQKEEIRLLNNTIDNISEPELIEVIKDIKEKENKKYFTMETYINDGEFKGIQSFFEKIANKEQKEQILLENEEKSKNNK